MLISSVLNSVFANCTRRQHGTKRRACTLKLEFSTRVRSRRPPLELLHRQWFGSRREINATRGCAKGALRAWGEKSLAEMQAVLRSQIHTRCAGC